MCPGWGLVSIRATSVFPWKWCYLGKQVGVSPRPRGDLRLGSSALRLPSPPPHFALRTESPPGGGAGAWGCGERRGRLAERRAPPPSGQSRRLKSLCPEGALAPKPGGPRGGEPVGLSHTQNLEAGGDSLLRKLMQASRKSEKEASKLAAMQSPGCREGRFWFLSCRPLNVRPISRCSEGSWVVDQVPFTFSLSWLASGGTGCNSCSEILLKDLSL